MTTARCILVAMVLMWSTGLRAAQRVELYSGDVLIGEVGQESAAALVLEHPVLGAITIPTEQIKAITNLEGEAAGAEGEANEKGELKKDGEAAGKEAAGGEKKEEKVGEVHWIDLPLANASSSFNLFSALAEEWNGQVEIGLSSLSGNKDQTNLYFSGKMERKVIDTRYKLDASYFMTEAQSEQTRNELTAGFLGEWDKPRDPFFHFGQARYDYNRFQDWEQRASGSGGLGYRWIDGEKLKVSSRAGMGVAKEFGTEAHDLRPEALMGSEVAWKINHSLLLNGDSTLLLNVLDSTQFRVLSNAGLKIRLNDGDSMSLKFGLQSEYDSTVSGDDKHHDLKVFGAFVVGF